MEGHAWWPESALKSPLIFLACQGWKRGEKNGFSKPIFLGEGRGEIIKISPRLEADPSLQS